MGRQPFTPSMDADSEGEEGKFYLFEKEELLSLLGEEGERSSQNSMVWRRKACWKERIS